VEALPVMPTWCLIDGLPVPRFAFPHTALVKGDDRSVSIAAASIIAKVIRDREMQTIAVAFPIYEFSKHKGYGTARHLALLRAHGPCPHHRRSFQPVAQLTLDL
jgi:ribonuclease HII